MSLTGIPMILRHFLRRFLSTTWNAAVKFKDARAAKPPLSQAFESFVLFQGKLSLY